MSLTIVPEDEWTAKLKRTLQRVPGSYILISLFVTDKMMKSIINKITDHADKHHFYERYFYEDKKFHQLTEVILI